MTQQISITQYTTLKNVSYITSISLGDDGDTITVTSKQDSVMGVAQPDLVTQWSLTDINNQIAYANAQIANLNSLITDAKGQ